MDSKVKRYISKENLDYDSFVDKINRLQEAKSITGTMYSEIRVFMDTIIGRRMSTKTRFFISAYDLYRALNELPTISFQSLKQYVNGYESPSLAILLGINALEPINSVEENSGTKNYSVIRKINGKFVVMTKKEAATHDSYTHYLRELQKLRKDEDEHKLKIEIGERKLNGIFPNDKKSENVDKNLNLGCLIAIVTFIIIGIPSIISCVAPDDFGDGLVIVIIFCISFTVFYYLWKCYKNQ